VGMVSEHGRGGALRIIPFCMLVLAGRGQPTPSGGSSLRRIAEEENEICHEP
jgi:hypothetical protein